MQIGEQEEEPGDGESKLWAHSLNFPEKGCLLVAHPLMFTTQQEYFSQARALFCCCSCSASLMRLWPP